MSNKAWVVGAEPFARRLCENFEDLGRGNNFCLVNTCKAGGGLLVSAFQHGLFLGEPLAQHFSS